MKICSKCGAEHATKQNGNYCPTCRREFAMQRARLYKSRGPSSKPHLRFSTINDEVAPIPPRTLIYSTKTQHEYLRSIEHRYWLNFSIDPKTCKVKEWITDGLLSPSPHVLNSKGTGCASSCPACAWSDGF